MQITLSVETYKGVDGSSLSTTRCSQIVQVYEMLERLGTKRMTYVDIQEEAEREKLFGCTNAKSAIRTFFPLLKKIGFVNYDDSIVANRCFTKLGTQFALLCRAYNKISHETKNKDEIIRRLINAKQNVQKEGLLIMYQNPEYKDHNMWIALKLFKDLESLNWNEFLYTLSSIEDGNTIDYALTQIKSRKEEIDSIEFVNEDGNTLPNTCYSYIRSFLEETGLISKINSRESKLESTAKDFFSKIDI